jgi:hypothetical protein
MAVTRLTTNGLTGTKYDIASADNYFMEPIATTLVGSGGVSSVTFSNIPNTYKHLQVRWLCTTNRGTYAIDDIKMTFNSDTGANYSHHNLKGNGSTASAGAIANANYLYYDVSAGTSVSNFFGVAITDILDYANTNKFKTIRALTGTDTNGSVAGEFGRVALQSGNWRNTAAITSITIVPFTGTSFNQHSRFSLYGIKG